MLAPKVAKPQPKATATPVGGRGHPRARIAARQPPGRGVAEQVLLLQRTIGNGATRRLLASRGLGVPGRSPGAPGHGLDPRIAALAGQRASPGADGTLRRQVEEGVAAAPGRVGAPVEASEFPPPEARRTLRSGSRGREVEYAQQRLNAFGAAPPLAVDGIFGPLTRKATIAYQQSHGLVPDGVIGRRSWASLDGPTVVGEDSGAGAGGGDIRPLPLAGMQGLFF